MNDRSKSPSKDTPALPEGDAWLSADEVAEASGLSVRTLADYRSPRGRRFGPPFHKRGRTVFYRQSEVIAWLEGGR